MPAALAKPSTPEQVKSTLVWLERRGSKKGRDGMARYGIYAKKMFGVSMGTMHGLAKRLGESHALAAGLWRSGWYEARILCAFVDEPARVTPAQMERWARAFDNWAICDTVCFHLFDKTPHAWRIVEPWSRRREEFVRRAAFALLASLALHDREAEDARFRHGLVLIERAADDDRNFVKKGVNWALRAIGKRNLVLHRAALVVAKRLAKSEVASARWIGKDALRELSSAATKKQVAARQARAARRKR